MSGGITDDTERGRATTQHRSSTGEDRRKAALAVAQHGTDIEDRRELLQALGLVDQDFKWVGDRYHGPRKKVTE